MLRTLGDLSDAPARLGHLVSAPDSAGLAREAVAYASRLASLAPPPSRSGWVQGLAGLIWGTVAVGLVGLGAGVVRPALRGRQAAEALAERAERRLHDVLDALPEAVYVADVDGKIVLRNRVAARLHERLGPSRPSADADAHVIVTGAAKTETAEIADGTWLTTTRSPLRGPGGNVVGVVAMARDATDQQVAAAELESARRAARAAEMARSRFMDGVSHELRTPLNGVLGMTELLMGTRLDEEQRELARTIQQSGKALAASVSNLLDLADIRAERVQPAEGAFEVRSVVESALASAAEGAASSGVHLRYLILSGVPRAVRGDELRVLQVLTNLLSNAAKFSPEGAAFVRVGSDTYSDGSLRLRFTVKDTGVGIAQNKLVPIFDAFTQVDGSTTRAYSGSGLGLTIARQLVALMGGEIGVESEEGKGSTFWFAIPVHPAQLTAEQEERAQSERTAPHLQAAPNAASAPEHASPAPSDDDTAMTWRSDPEHYVEKGKLESRRFSFTRSAK
jgi:signal transduction histidine kinase